MRANIWLLRFLSGRATPEHLNTEMYMILVCILKYYLFSISHLMHYIDSFEIVYVVLFTKISCVIYTELENELYGC